jgi:23S rRNA (guanine2445-N2)-methyltransferase / 23S rRNA (guanine2069-N7)-methyltransferase
VDSAICGSDIAQGAVDTSRSNAQRAGVAGLVSFERSAFQSVRPSVEAPGLICTNPPYGERLGDTSQAETLHAELGSALREHFAGWDAAILTAQPEAARALRLRSYRVHELWNGAIACRLLRIDLGNPGSVDGEASRLAREAAVAASPGAQMFANRMEKNLKRLGKVAQRALVSCYRLYDADMPEYAFAIDRYLEAATQAVHLHVQEYAPPKDIDVEAARRRRREALSSLPRLFAIPSERIHLRLRARQSGSAQYQPVHAQGAGPFAVEEAGLRFLVNLDDYLDTGLFLDHRLTRARLRERARAGRFLNLFCYTASASVYAAAGGARSSLSLDLSNRYLDWAGQNFALNAMAPGQHRLERADCLEWLRSAPPAQFDLIFLDPPTFSNSKRMQGVLDIQRDHVLLIEQCMQRLAPAGLLVFACNAQRFRLDEQVRQRWQVEDVSALTLPFDFARNPRIHRCYEITTSPGA